MKNYFQLFLLFVISISSCVTAKTYTTEEKKMRDPSVNCYILKTNGEKITGKKITRPSSFNLSQNFLKIDDRKIDDTEIVAFQDKNAYYKTFDRKEQGGVWVKQLKRGAINLYYFESVTTKYSVSGKNANDYHEHFVFEKPGVNLPLAELSIPDIASILKDNKKAYDVFTARFGSTDKKFLPKQLDKDPKVIFEAVDIYNGNQ